MVLLFDLEFYVELLMMLLLIWNSLNTSTYIVSSGPTAIFFFTSCFLINGAIPFIYHLSSLIIIFFVTSPNHRKVNLYIGIKPSEV